MYVSCLYPTDSFLTSRSQRADTYLWSQVLIVLLLLSFVTRLLNLWRVVGHNAVGKDSSRKVFVFFIYLLDCLFVVASGVVYQIYR